MKFISSLKKAFNHNSSQNGTYHFWAQRFSAVGNFIAGLWFIYAVIQIPGFEYNDVLSFIESIPNSLMLIFLVLTMAYHSYLGIQVIVEDYVHAHKFKLSTLTFSRFVHILLVGTAIFAIIKIRLGA